MDKAKYYLSRIGKPIYMISEDDDTLKIYCKKCALCEAHSNSTYSALSVIREGALLAVTFEKKMIYFKIRFANDSYAQQPLNKVFLLKADAKKALHKINQEKLLFRQSLIKDGYILRER